MLKRFAAIAVLALLQLPVSDAGAHDRHANRYLRHASPHASSPHPSSYVARGRGYRQPDGWYVHDADKLRIGSPLWWQQMLREDRVRN
jgi:hypothetical protein